MSVLYAFKRAVHGRNETRYALALLCSYCLCEFTWNFLSLLSAACIRATISAIYIFRSREPLNAVLCNPIWFVFCANRVSVHFEETSTSKSEVGLIDLWTKFTRMCLYLPTSNAWENEIKVLKQKLGERRPNSNALFGPFEQQNVRLNGMSVTTIRNDLVYILLAYTLWLVFRISQTHKPINHIQPNSSVVVLRLTINVNGISKWSESNTTEPI